MNTNRKAALKSVGRHLSVLSNPQGTLLSHLRPTIEGTILSAPFEVLEAAKGVEVKASVGTPLNHGSRDAVEMLPIQLNWDGSKAGSNRYHSCANIFQ